MSKCRVVEMKQVLVRIRRWLAEHPFSKRFSRGRRVVRSASRSWKSDTAACCSVAERSSQVEPSGMSVRLKERRTERSGAVTSGWVTLLPPFSLPIVRLVCNRPLGDRSPHLAFPSSPLLDARGRRFASRVDKVIPWRNGSAGSSSFYGLSLLLFPAS